MAASRSYLGRGNYRYFSGEREGPMGTDLMFEFNEFDIWNVASSPDFHKNVTASRISKKSVPAMEKRGEARGTAMSLPVDVPDWSMILKEELNENRRTGNDYDDFDEDLYGAENRIPPHEYLARGRIASFSVHEGIGRTLKGRDLSRVRNAVWKKIGFED
ncbi:uncharacterized protein LOC112519262 [Cynara cardunculus var. scolymus]|uniref:Senescence regulator n=1 Tax=Cynara cardunculus var. scolymus TaxID=59895 RepID=A0A124SEI5_CYNCS|nr:uncharacterized protein LOC112519262 [Cynara cardunculus var. scolymus]KVI00196.1 Senescence regulator [Cynara cardunculus var. scolymus]